MTSRRSSGSRRAASAVEPTRSQNITVSCRRSASAETAPAGATCAATGGASERRAAIAARSFRRADRAYADADQVVGRQLRQHFAIDIVVAECRRVLFEPQPAQPRCYVHAVILGSEER